MRSSKELVAMCANRVVVVAAAAAAMEQIQLNFSKTTNL